MHDFPLRLLSDFPIHSTDINPITILKAVFSFAHTSFLGIARKHHFVQFGENIYTRTAKTGIFVRRYYGASGVAQTKPVSDVLISFRTIALLTNPLAIELAKSNLSKYSRRLLTL